MEVKFLPSLTAAQVEATKLFAYYVKGNFKDGNSRLVCGGRAREPKGDGRFSQGRWHAVAHP